MSSNIEYVLGIDTSNYRTSVAVIDNKRNIIYSKNELLDVRKGERGLRQSTALFQHVNKLPDILNEALEKDDIRKKIKCVAVSTRPRNIEGSYMPVFLAGKSIALSIGSALGVPVVEVSHQDGHIAAAKKATLLENSKKFIAFHFSGGTTEALLYNNHQLRIIGGTKDISYGQLIDRIGVKLGFSFPSGQYMDDLLMSSHIEQCKGNPLSIIKVNDGYFNLSGIETQCMHLLDDKNSDFVPEEIISFAFSRILESMNIVMKQLNTSYDIKDFLFAGGVSSSQYFRNNISQEFNAYFSEAWLSGDNAVGVALIGGESIWEESQPL